MNVYEKLGVKTYINAWATMSLFTGSRMRQETVDAMREASHSFVKLEDLEEAVGRELAKMTRNEAAYVTCGASSGILNSVAVAMAGADRERLFRLPDTTGMKNEFVMLRSQRNDYDFAVKACGGKLVEVGTKEGCTLEEFEAAFTENTAGVLYADFTYNHAKDPSIKEVVKVAKAHGARVIVDAAAQLPPISNLWYFTEECGADVALFSGGKGLRGPQQGGLCVGKADFLAGFKYIAAPNQGINRSSKVGREEIIGVYTAVKRYTQEGFEENLLRYLEATSDKIAEELQASGLFECDPDRDGPLGQSYRTVKVTPKNGISAYELAKKLREVKPRGILVGGMYEGTTAISVNPQNIEPDEIDIVINAIITTAKEMSA